MRHFRSYEKAWERGVNTYIDGSHGGGRTATGSGPVTWNHDHSAAGIADLCGNCWEWVSGARLVNGEIQIIPYGNSMKSDCSMGADSTEWKAIMPDGRLVEPGTAGTLKIDRTSGSDAKLRINTGVASSVISASPPLCSCCTVKRRQNSHTLSGPSWAGNMLCHLRHNSGTLIPK